MTEECPCAVCTEPTDSPAAERPVPPAYTDDYAKGWEKGFELAGRSYARLLDEARAALKRERQLFDALEAAADGQTEELHRLTIENVELREHLDDVMRHP